ncbi:MAG: HAMP domain-containing protein [Magnetococcus sp. DMHC-8]
MRLTNGRISTRLSFTIAFTLFFFVAVTVSFTFVLQTCLRQNQFLRDRELHIQQLANEVALQMLQARRAEKDFLLRRELPLVDRVAEAVQEAIRQANAVIRLSREAGHTDVEVKAAQIVQAMNGYLEAFQGLARGHVAIGLTAEEGLQGRFRHASHALEEMVGLTETETVPGGARDVARQPFAQVPGEVITYLALRRAEKDYLLRHDAQDATGVHAMLRALHDRIAISHRSEPDKQQAIRLLRDYEHAFDAMLRQDADNAVLMATLRTVVHPVEPLSQEIRQVSQLSATRMAADIQSSGERISVLLLLFSLLTVAVCGVVCGAIIRSIARSLREMERFAGEVAGGHWEAVVPAGGGDEMTRLADAMCTLMRQARAIRLLSDRLLLTMVLVGRGTIPARVEEEGGGDFARVSAVLNRMVDTLSTIPLVTRRLEQLHAGAVPDPLDDPPCGGEVKQLVTVLNNMVQQRRTGPSGPP